jgi:P27 family predicted phage terminase small subunit
VDAAPAWLSDDARAVWDGLAAAGVDGDADTLIVYCCAVADYRAAQQGLDSDGTLIRGRGGVMVRSPLHSVKAANAATMRVLARELGLTATKPDTDSQARAGRRNGAATERTIAALRAGGRLEGVDAAATALVRHLASALDGVDPVRCPAQTASLARVYLVALRNLRGDDADDRHDTGALDDLLAVLSSPVGDATESRTPDVR